MNKLDILDMVIVENVYDKFVQNKHKTGFIPMHNKPVDVTKINMDILTNEQEHVDFLLELSLMLLDGPSEGEFTHMDIIYTMYEDDVVICAMYQQKHQEYIAVCNKGNTILINGFKDDEYYFKFYNLISIFKELYYLN